MREQFVHLHTHSHFSLLNAVPKIKDLVSRAKEYDMPALALTDSGNLYGAIQFYRACKDAGIKPILGIDLYIAPRSRHDKEARIDNQWTRLVVLAKNETGYRNLVKLATRGFLEGFYYKPRVDKELLEEHKEGLIAIIPSFAGSVSRALENGNTPKAKEELLWFQSIFGAPHTFIEITHHPEIEGHEAKMITLKEFGRANGANLVAAHDTYYLQSDDSRAREAMMRIQSGTTLESEERPEDFSFVSPQKMSELFKGEEDLLAQTLSIAEMCNVELELGSWTFPKFEVPEGSTYEKELLALTEKGLKERKMERTKEVKERIEYELSVINEKGFAPYFLVVSDLLKFARDNDILTTTRGSAAGSLVSFLCRITNIDPIEYKLPFERFLNPERPKAPDIDMDYADDRRDEVIEYAKEKYGEDKVAQIGTFGTMMARAAVRDVARVLGHPYTIGDQIAKLIPLGAQGFPMTIDRALSENKELEDLYKKDKIAKEIIDLAKKIEGSARHISVHAAGVVISPTPLTDFVPLQFDPKGGKIITQYDMHAVEDAGLLKFDFLGIKNLSILAAAKRRVKKLHGIDVDIENVPVDDTKTFEMLARGETHGLFQLNGSGMTHFLKELKPTEIYDINAMVALYRPGPMESIPSYIERKHNPHLVTYLDERLKEILDRSYGVITYQDDVLMIAVTLGGYSWLEADTLRKAMGKKIPKIMQAEKEKLIDGFINHGNLSKDKAERLWKLIEPFAAYGFNKAHAASYGKVAYQTAYMKAHYPVEYMSAVMTADSGDVEKIAESIAECKRMGIVVLPPDINESYGDFAVVPNENQIRFGLYSIKNFGSGIAERIIEERKVGGHFKTLAEFLERVQDKNLNRKTLEALIKSGALDTLGNRADMLFNIDGLLAYSREHGSSGGSQDSLFGNIEEASPLRLSKADPLSAHDILAWEKELLGLYISGHPLDRYKEKLSRLKADIKAVKENTREGMPVLIAGIVEDIRPIMTKSGEQMAFVRISDYTSSVEAVIFPRIYKAERERLVPETCIALKGHFSMRNGEPSIVSEAIQVL